MTGHVANGLYLKSSADLLETFKYASIDAVI
ncbi:hypothetical protein SAMN06295945_0354 [Polynucleobacter meluiroseus]|uniref:Uncharacterized protein n=1 Tax=Polynucleobacter meluiroseus TaxID=1938814 RepID=A0A240DXW5_9BURK|nr:hypothetical protein SAMN06295945_0354 [Polynucleobacter meluiroseus]